MVNYGRREKVVFEYGKDDRIEVAENADLEEVPSILGEDVEPETLEKLMAHTESGKVVDLGSETYEIRIDGEVYNSLSEAIEAEMPGDEWYARETCGPTGDIPTS